MQGAGGAPTQGFHLTVFDAGCQLLFFSLLSMCETVLGYTILLVWLREGLPTLEFSFPFFVGG